MTSINQDFTSHAGDDLRVVFTIRDNDGAIVDISEVEGIVWNLYDEFDRVVMTRSLSDGEIEFVADGEDGQIKVTVSEHGAIATAALFGWYWHAAYVVDSVGNLSQFAIGRGLFGPRISAPFDDGDHDPPASAVYYDDMAFAGTSYWPPFYGQSAIPHADDMAYSAPMLS